MRKKAYLVDPLSFLRFTSLSLILRRFDWELSKSSSAVPLISHR
jgi:hypothetical protein